MAADALTLPIEVDEALAGLAKAEGFKEPRFHVERGSNVGDGFMSILYRIKIQEENGAPNELSLMCKATTPNTEGSIMMERVFEVEGCIYSKALPAMQEVAHFTEPLPWPRSYHVSVSGPPPLFLVLADLRPSGYAMVERGKPMDESHCRHMLTQLARYHGAGMALQELRPQEFQDLRAMLAKNGSFEDMPDTFLPFLKSVEVAPDLITERFPEGGEINTKLKKVFTNFPNEFFNTMLPHPDGGNTIIHGDCHFNNVLFRYDKATGAVTGCRLIDFQGARYTSPAVDLVQLLFGSTSKAMRDEHWDGLLRGYHNELQATLRNAGCTDPDAIYSWDLFMTHMRLYARHGLCFAPLFLFVMHGDGEAVKAIQDTVGQFVNNPDPDKDEAKPVTPTITLKGTPEFKSRLGDLVQDLLDWGWL